MRVSRKLLVVLGIVGLSVIGGMGIVYLGVTAFRSHVQKAIHEYTERQWDAVGRESEEKLEKLYAENPGLREELEGPKLKVEPGQKLTRGQWSLLEKEIGSLDSDAAWKRLFELDPSGHLAAEYSEGAKREVRPD